MKNHLIKIVLFLLAALPAQLLHAENWRFVDPPDSEHNLRFEALAQRWDEGMPMGNGLLGALLWQKENNLRISLDRVDLWDDRPMPEIDQLKFRWVIEKVSLEQYDSVQMLGDLPYERTAAPTKIPGAALSFDLSKMGKVVSNELDIQNGLNTVRFDNGGAFQTYVHATENYGVFLLDDLPQDIFPDLEIPSYTLKDTSGASNSVAGQGLGRLGYSEGKLNKTDKTIHYHQPTHDGDFYEVLVQWEALPSGKVMGIWTISSNEKAQLPPLGSGLASSQWEAHLAWWASFWKQSSVKLPDPILERQYYLEMYKFACVARSHTPPISLQAVWTADNGKLPPWKGDFHHDLNTQLSYWPAYAGNYLEEASGYTNWLWKNRNRFKKYTQNYFETDGLNVPGVTTLDGDPMGGWIQYALGPTVSAWLAHHFYLQWRYSMDEQFLSEQAYPWIRGVADFLVQVSEKDNHGMRKLPISSSPEIHDNSLRAWFDQTTNFDLAMIRWTFEKAHELAFILNKEEEALRWKRYLSEWPPLAVDPKLGLLVAPQHPLTESHRHHSFMVGFHPLGILDYSQGSEQQQIIDQTLANLDALGTEHWVGYSFSWLGNMKARAFDGEGAAEALRIFASAFCLPNSFHVNGDQSGKGYANATYRPFTLEGNFAFAAGIQEMLLQSHTKVIRVFPAIPQSWEEVSYSKLRAQGAFLISADFRDQKVDQIVIESEKGGILKIFNPFGSKAFRSNTAINMEKDTIVIPTVKGQTIVLKAEW